MLAVYSWRGKAGTSCMCQGRRKCIVLVRAIGIRGEIDACCILMEGIKVESWIVCQLFPLAACLSEQFFHQSPRTL